MKWAERVATGRFQLLVNLTITAHARVCMLVFLLLRRITVGVCLRIDTCIIYIGDVKMTGHCLILAGMKGCQV